MISSSNLASNIWRLSQPVHNFTIRYSKVCQFVSGILTDMVPISEVIHFVSGDRRKAHSEKQRVVVTVVRLKISTFV